ERRFADDLAVQVGDHEFPARVLQDGVAAPDALAGAARELLGDDRLQQQPPLGGLAGRLLVDLARLLHPEADGALVRVQARDDSRVGAADPLPPCLEPLLAAHPAGIDSSYSAHAGSPHFWASSSL